MKTALLAGASGLTGNHCLTALLQDSSYDKVIALVRKPLAIQHRKLELKTVSFDRLDAALSELKGDDIFCCLGTTIKNAGSRDAFLVVDYAYPLALAQATQKNGA